MSGFKAGLIFFILVTCMAGTVRGSDLQTLLDRHLEAIGGAEAVSRMNSLKATGMILVGRERARFELWAAFPNKLRLESRIGDRIFVQSYDGNNEPWEWFPETMYDLPEEMAFESAREFISDADFSGPLVHHRGKGHKLIMEGLETVDGNEVFRVRVNERSGLISSFLIDAENFLIVRRSGQREGGGASIDLETYYLDYREVSGVLLPHRYEVYRGTTLVRTVLIQSIEANRRIPSAVFAMPNGPDPIAARMEAEQDVP